MEKKEMLIVKSKAKELLKADGFAISPDVYDALNEVTHWLIDQAKKRAQDNGRKTVRKHDILSY